MIASQIRIVVFFVYDVFEMCIAHSLQPCKTNDHFCNDLSVLREKVDYPVLKINSKLP